MKLDHREISVAAAEGQIATGLTKFGAIVGDRTEIGCNAVINPGSVLGRDCIIYPGANFRGVLPDSSIVKVRQKLQMLERRDKKRARLHLAIGVLGSGGFLFQPTEIVKCRANHEAARGENFLLCRPSWRLRFFAVRKGPSRLRIIIRGRLRRKGNGLKRLRAFASSCSPKYVSRTAKRSRSFDIKNVRPL